MSDTRYIFGFHAVTAKIRHAPDAVKELFVSTARQDGRMRDLIRAAEASGVKWVQMEPARLDGLAGGAARHQGVVARVLAQIPYRSLDDVLDTLSEPPQPFDEADPVGAGEVGRYIGAQMAAANLMAAPVPEPSTWLSMLAGLAVVGRMCRRRIR